MPSVADFLREKEMMAWLQSRFMNDWKNASEMLRGKWTRANMQLFSNILASNRDTYLNPRTKGEYVFTMK